ncbi:MAG: large-conductance mechanosensitive channel protein MscL [Candidatus Omnitrophota bacterium]|jgi:large conductance mechanosensitive channel
MKKTVEEFKAFIMRGNVLDMAIGIIIGGAFGKIVTSLVNDVIMPPIGLLLGKVDFSSLFINLSGKPYASLVQAQAAGAPTINYGLFVNTLINFLIVAFVIFMLVKQVNRFATKPAATGPAAAPVTKECPQCCSTIAVKAKRCPACTSVIA